MSLRLATFIVAVACIAACAARAHVDIEQDLRRRCFAREADFGVSSMFVSLGEPGRQMLLRVATSGDLDDAACGIEILADLGDPRVIQPLTRALLRAGDDPEIVDALLRGAWRLATFPDATLTQRLAPVADATRPFTQHRHAGVRERAAAVVRAVERR
jgi:hypothetical protein